MYMYIVFNKYVILFVLNAMAEGIFTWLYHFVYQICFD